MTRTIVQTGNAVLRAIAKDVPKEDFGSARLTSLIADMRKLLAKEKYGVALAAPQVGEPLRLFIVSGKALGERESSSKKQGTVDNNDDSQQTTDYRLQTIPDQVYINPELLKMSRGKKDKHEGCLSVRGKWGMVPRAEKTTISAYDENGKPFIRGASGLLAHIFQHEMDHLEGLLYTDKAKELYDDKETADE